MTEVKKQSGRQFKYLEFYDAFEVRSAFIKSIRLGKVEDAIYWLEVMLIGGAKPKNIAKRMMVDSQEAGLGISPAVYSETVYNILKNTDDGAIDALFQLTVYLCNCKKWWEDEIMREYVRKWISIRHDVEKVSKRQLPARPIPKYAIDIHTRRGKIQQSMGESIDDRFSGTIEGQFKMMKLYEKNGRLDENDYLTQAEESEIKEFLNK